MEPAGRKRGFASRRLRLRHHFDFDEAAEGDGGDGEGGAGGRIFSEAAAEDFVHGAIVGDVGEIDVTLDGLEHGGADVLEVGFDGIEDPLGLFLDGAAVDFSGTGDEDEAVGGDDRGIQGEFAVGGAAVFPVGLLPGGLFLVFGGFGGRHCQSGGPGGEKGTSGFGHSNKLAQLRTEAEAADHAEEGVGMDAEKVGSLFMIAIGLGEAGG